MNHMSGEPINPEMPEVYPEDVLGPLSPSGL